MLMMLMLCLCSHLLHFDGDHFCQHVFHSLSPCKQSGAVRGFPQVRCFLWFETRLVGKLLIGSLGLVDLCMFGLLGCWSFACLDYWMLVFVRLLICWIVRCWESWIFELFDCLIVGLLDLSVCVFGLVVDFVSVGCSLTNERNLLKVNHLFQKHVPTLFDFGMPWSHLPVNLHICWWYLGISKSNTTDASPI